MIYNEYSYWMTLTGSKDDINKFINRLMTNPNTNAPHELVHDGLAPTNNPNECICNIHVDDSLGTISEWTTSTEDITNALKDMPNLEVVLESIDEEDKSNQFIELWHHGKYVCDTAKLTIKTPDELRTDLAKL